jgi:hypothetical protein
MADLGDSGKGKATVPTGRNDTPQRQRMLAHIRGGPQRAVPRKEDDAVAAARRKRFIEAFQNEEALAKTDLDAATRLLADKALPASLKDEFLRQQRLFETGKKLKDVVGARARLVDLRKAAHALMHAARGLELKKAQVAQQGALFEDMAPVMASVRSASFPQGQAAYIAKLDLSAGKLFKDYLAKLAALESKKAEGQKVTAKGGQLGPAFRVEIKTRCLELVAAADACLTFHEQQLSSKQQNEKSSQSKKRYCEEGKLAAFQYMMAIEFEALPDPKSTGGWSEQDEVRAASLRAKLNYHQAYQEAAKLGDDGDAAGASESRWLQGVDYRKVQDASPTRNAEWERTDNKRVAIFKAAAGEVAPIGFASDKRGAGAIKEALASANAKLFAQMTGIDLNVPETNVVSINRYALKGGGPRDEDQRTSDADEVIGSAQSNAGAKHQLGEMPDSVRSRIKTKDVQKMAILDIMMLNGDRHAGNIMVKDDPQGEPALVPIDHGGSLPARADFGAAARRIAGITYFDVAGTATVVNELLSMPSAYEPFDKELLEQLELLKPQAIVEGMVRQRAAINAVHPGLGAVDKLPDDRLHLSKCAMMFMKRAARFMSPAEIQIAIAQRGPELFDAPDEPTFNAAADRIVSDFAPKREAYKDIFTGPADQLSAMVTWLGDNGWTALDAADSTMTGSAFVMRHPELALKLFRTQTPNTNPADVERGPQEPKDPKDDVSKGLPSQRFRDGYMTYFKEAKPDVEDKVWRNREHHWQALAKLGGTAAYDRVLAATGAKPDNAAKTAVHTMALWQELNKPTHAAALRAAAAPNGAGKSVNGFLSELLKRSHARAADSALASTALQAALALNDNDALKAGVESALRRIRVMVADPLLAAAAQRYRVSADGVDGLLAQGQWDAAHDAAAVLEGEVDRRLRDAIAADAEGKAQAFIKTLSAQALIGRVEKALGNVVSACFNQKSRTSAGEALAALEKTIADLGQQLTSLPAFGWDTGAASAAKKAAIRGGYIPDRDTGLSDALKAVAAAQKDFDAVLGSKVKAEKKRPAGEKAIAAYRGFIAFVDTRLRPLAPGHPVTKEVPPAWTEYCGQAVKAANDKIGFIRALMVNWP